MIFLADKNSQIDVVQSVGRVMRRAPGKTYGYIILPIVVNYTADPKQALNTGVQYKVVWQVLNALRAHDERLKNTINKITLNRTKPDQIVVGRPDGQGDGTESAGAAALTIPTAAQVEFQFTDFQNALYAKMVEKVGDRGYFSEWAQNVAELAERHTKRIGRLVKREGEHKEAFASFLDGLRQNINPSVKAEQAVEMLAQHIISKPVFESLFEDYSFSKDNAVSQAMEGILSIIEAQSLEEEDQEKLSALHDYVKRKVADIDNAAGKQKVIVELYDKFFSAGFPKLVEQLGIVYTPVEIVDFIIHSVNDVLRQEFGKSLSDEGVSILDPFTGTGTFVTRLLQSGLIKPEDLERKYHHEIFANEIVLLAYYIAAINIENAYHDLKENGKYEGFPGIVLADTFQMTEGDPRLEPSLHENFERIKRQKEAPIRVIISNPPYSVGQKDANDAAANQDYPRLHSKITDTYAYFSRSKNLKSLFDSYIKAFRWSTDRIDPEKGGIIAFVSNGSWLEDNSKDGFRASLEQEFSNIHIFDLRGKSNISGEARRREGGNVFGEGSKTRIAITLLIKKPDLSVRKAEIHYHDIGDYLDRRDKLKLISKHQSMLSKTMQAQRQKLCPNPQNDWLNQRRPFPAHFVPIAQDRNAICPASTLGAVSNRDAWVCNFSLSKLRENMKKTITFYNSEVGRYVSLDKPLDNNQLAEFTTNDSESISWNDKLRQSIKLGSSYLYKEAAEQTILYRPFCKQRIYFDNLFVSRPGSFHQLLNSSRGNRFIVFSDRGTTTDFSVLIIDTIADLHILGTNRCIPLYVYSETQVGGILQYADQDAMSQGVNISSTFHRQAESKYGVRIEKEAIFYYLYGLLHSPSYKDTFRNNFSKEMPHIPLVEGREIFMRFTKAGRQLAELHINYEEVEPYPLLGISGIDAENYQVNKMRFKSKDRKDTIVFNSHITVSKIPERAYEYVLNGRSVIEWIMERYQIKTDKASGIVNDPNDWSKEAGNPRYILDLLSSVINISVQTADIVERLPDIYPKMRT